MYTSYTSEHYVQGKLVRLLSHGLNCGRQLSFAELFSPAENQQMNADC